MRGIIKYPCPFCGEDLDNELKMKLNGKMKTRKEPKVGDFKKSFDLLIEKLGVHPEDIESRSMGRGEDLIRTINQRKISILN